MSTPAASIRRARSLASRLARPLVAAVVSETPPGVPPAPVKPVSPPQPATTPKAAAKAKPAAKAKANAGGAA